jgi:hypothetical protein
LEREPAEILENNLNHYFDTVMIRLQNALSRFVWNADETRAQISEMHVAPDLIVAKQTPPGTVTITEEHNDSQMTLLAWIPAFEDSIPPLFISKNKTFEAERLPEQQLFHGHDYVMTHVEKTFMTEAAFVDWLQTLLILKNDELLIKAHYDGPIILLINGYPSHVTPHLIADGGSQRIALIRLVAHSSYTSQPLDFCVFPGFKILYGKERKRANWKEKRRRYIAPFWPFIRSR